MSHPNCAWCGHWFKPRSRAQIFCRQACERNSANQRKREGDRLTRAQRTWVCAHCDKTFVAELGKPGVKVHCSEKCRKAARQDYWRAWYRAKKANPTALRRPTNRIPVQARVCSSCVHWGAKGCGLEVARTCNPGVMSRYWAKREAVSA